MTVVTPPWAAARVTLSQLSAASFRVRWCTWASMAPGRMTLPLASMVRAARPGRRAASSSSSAAMRSPLTAIPAATTRLPTTTWSPTTTRSCSAFDVPDSAFMEWPPGVDILSRTEEGAAELYTTASRRTILLIGCKPTADYLDVEDASHWGPVLNRRAPERAIPAVLEWIARDRKS